MTEAYDVVIVGGGPAGLSAALALGRASRRVLVCDAGPRRNERAHAVQNFVTRDGTPPNEFRSIAREQLSQYPSVEFLDARVDAITPSTGGLAIKADAHQLQARRVLLCTGVVDQPMGIVGFDALWGRSIFQCPYCHGWERRNQRWGYLASSVETLDFALVLLQWSPRVTVFTQGSFAVSEDKAAMFRRRGVLLEERGIVEFVGGDGASEPHLEAVRLADGNSVPCDVLFAHPKQTAGTLIRNLGVALDDNGFIAIDAMTRQTSVPGVYAAGDVTTRLQAAIVAAASGMQAAAAINHNLAME